MTTAVILSLHCTLDTTSHLRSSGIPGICILTSSPSDSSVQTRVGNAGPLFNIIIPMPEEQEAEDYVARLRNAFAEYEDEVLVPSVAFGIVYKTNVEESLADKISDAEYEMFNDKLEIKNAPDYRDKLTKGIRK